MLFTVFYAVLSVVLVLTIAIWLRAELRVPVRSLKAGWYWLVAIITLQLFAGVLAEIYNPHGLGNVLLHTIGGGAVSALVFFYLSYTFRLRVSWRVQLVLLFCCACTLGVLNELAEFAMELLRVGVFSYDSQDTWRDLTANTSGAVCTWLIIRTAGLIKHIGGDNTAAQP
jgi:hypothetical protein